MRERERHRERERERDKDKDRESVYINLIKEGIVWRPILHVYFIKMRELVPIVYGVRIDQCVCFRFKGGSYSINRYSILRSCFMTSSTLKGHFIALFFI